MAEIIQSVFIDPPIAVARLGGSNAPQDAYLWVESPDPRMDGDTTLFPTWSLTVLPDGSVEPNKPSELIFRDGALIRPVCPFFEVWARVGEPGGVARDVPLTPKLLAQFGVDPSALTFRIDAHNLKAARRTGKRDLGFGTFPPVEIKGDNHSPVVLFAVSPPGADPAMIPKERNIPLGSVQVLRSKPNPDGVEWANVVDLAVIRLRFTPGRGRFYGPPQAAMTTPDFPSPAVTEQNAFLNPKAGWFGARSSQHIQGIVQPADTYDGAETTRNDDGPSLGVVDDTCEARIEVALILPGRPGPLEAAASVFCGPPDFAPDRRPFLSLADELNDRAADGRARDQAMSAADRDAWVGDLFERIYDTVSLLNVDRYRAERGVTLRGARLRPQKIAGDGLGNPEQAMGGRDALRDSSIVIAAPVPDRPLPLAERARDRHRNLSDLDILRRLITDSPGRLQALVRAPFAIEDIEAGSGGNDDNVTAQQTTMRMPPFMRQSNAQPLTLSAWQYRLLMDWAAAAAAAARVAPHAAPAVPALSAAASGRRTAVLARVRASRGNIP
jgi:hypothetical protein